MAGYTILETLDDFRTLLGSRWWVSLTALFAAANLVWALSGIAWMRRLPRRYAERTGRAFDGLPTLLLFVAVALTTAATTIAVTL